MTSVNQHSRFFLSIAVTVLICGVGQSVRAQQSGGESSAGDAPGIPRAQFGVPTYNLPVKAVKRGYLGAVLVALTPELRLHFGASEDVGVMVARVEPRGPAANAGIRVGDVIVAANNEAVQHVGILHRSIVTRSHGETVDLDVVRDKKRHRVRVTVEERARPQVDLSRVFFGRRPGNGVSFHLSGPEFESRMRDFKKILERETSLEGRIMVLEQRIRQLEKQLDINQ